MSEGIIVRYSMYGICVCVYVGASSNVDAVILVFQVNIFNKENYCVHYAVVLHLRCHVNLNTFSVNTGLSNSTRTFDNLDIFIFFAYLL